VFSFPGGVHAVHRQQSRRGFRTRSTRAATGLDLGRVALHDLRATHAACGRQRSERARKASKGHHG
jgi:hypothetical protein